MVINQEQSSNENEKRAHHANEYGSHPAKNDSNWDENKKNLIEIEMSSKELKKTPNESEDQ